MITLEEYKKYLISTYQQEYDNTLEKQKERKKRLEKNYSDEYLAKIIDNTYELVKKILEANEVIYYNVELSGEDQDNISLNLIGGFNSDIIYKDIYGNLISKYILKETFGPRLCVSVNEEIIDFDTEDEDIVSYDFEYILYMQGFPDDMTMIKQELFGVSKKLIK